MDKLNEEGPLGCVRTTAGIVRVMSLALIAPKDARSSPVTAEMAMPTSWEFCARFCAVTTISSTAGAAAADAAKKGVDAVKGLFDKKK